MTASELSRRKALRLAAGVLLGVAAGGRGARARADPAAAMLRVGRRYLAEFPHEADPAWLRAHIGGAEGYFRRGDTLWLHGWLLARSEARLCALAVVDGRA